MRANKSKGTGPELALRKELWRRGCRGYRLNVRSLPGSPDVAFIGRKIAIFVHGCFWHGCTMCSRYQEPKTNQAFWRAKLEANRARDQRALQKLEELGYQTVVVWECQVDSNLAGVVDTLASQVRPTAENVRRSLESDASDRTTATA